MFNNGCQTTDQKVTGSNPAERTNKNNRLELLSLPLKFVCCTLAAVPKSLLPSEIII
jgi:hypothetical protein